MTLREQAADQRRARIVDLARPLDREATAAVGPPTCIEVGVAHLALGVFAALTTALDLQDERQPAHADVEAFGQFEGRVLGQVGVGLL